MNDTFGLFSKNSEPVPLMGVAVKGDILGRGARVRVLQRFRNLEKKSIDAVYKFPLPEGAAICGFKAIIDGRVIHGEIEEREKAFKIFDQALSEGHGGYLLDEERPNIFTLSVGNLKPDTEVVVEIEYVTLLDMEGAKARFYLPTTISPRYIPGNTPERDGIPEGERVTPAYAVEVPYGLSLDLNVHEGGMIETVVSPSHPVSIEIGKEPIHVSFSSDSVKMDRDFILYMGYKESFQNRAYLCQSGEEVFYQLDMVFGDDEKQTSRDSEKEIIFVLDCSGSMDGDSIREAKKALEICLKGMDKNTAFNIYRFGSTFQSLFKQSQGYSEKTLEKAVDYLKNVKADLGGTEALAPLEHIYRRHENPFLFKVKRNIVFLTDGEVGNEQEVFSLVRRNRDNTSFFPVGIGAGPNELFIKGTARAGQGAFEFIYPGERIEPKVLRIFQNLSQRSFEKVVVQWGDGPWEQTPQDPTFFLGNPVTVFAKGSPQNDQPGKFLEIKGAINGRGMQWKVEVATQGQDGKFPIPVLWARERIRDLEEMDEGASKEGSKQAERKGKLTRDTILELSKKYGILSSLTSFVAIEEREEKDKYTGEFVLRKVPSLVTVGWHGMPRASVAKLAARSPISFRDVDYSIVSSLRVPEPRARLRIQPEESRIQKIDVLMEILSLQRAEGGLELTPEICRLLHIPFDEIRSLAAHMQLTPEIFRLIHIRLNEIRDLSSKIELTPEKSLLINIHLDEIRDLISQLDIPEDRFLILSTAICLLLLQTFFMDEESSWRNVVHKSRKWLEDVIQEGHPKIQGRELMEWVKGYVREKIRLNDGSI